MFMGLFQHPSITQYIINHLSSCKDVARLSIVCKSIYNGRWKQLIPLRQSKMDFGIPNLTLADVCAFARQSRMTNITSIVNHFMCFGGCAKIRPGVHLVSRTLCKYATCMFCFEKYDEFYAIGTRQTRFRVAVGDESGERIQFLERSKLIQIKKKRKFI